MSDPLVSVVIPTFNAADRIGKTLAQIESQTYSQLEIIVVDDGSRDGTADIAEQHLQSSRFPCRVIRQANAGPSTARNTGWRAARGHWIQFLDDDDTIDVEKLRLQVDAIAAFPDEPAIGYSMWARCVDDGHGAVRVSEVRRPKVGARALVDLLRTENFIHLGSALVARQWLEMVDGFDAALWMVEDVDLQIRIAGAGGDFTELHSDRPMFFYHSRPGSLSASNERLFVDGIARNAKTLLEIATLRAEATDAVRRAVCDCLVQKLLFDSENSRTEFDATYAYIRSVQPGYVRSHNRAFGVLTSLVGWKRAELLAAALRRRRVRRV
jgi:glycosyltransferase involved in cell wall biosynthesis